MELRAYLVSLKLVNSNQYIDLLMNISRAGHRRKPRKCHGDKGSRPKDALWPSMIVTLVRQKASGPIYQRGTINADGDTIFAYGELVMIPDLLMFLTINDWLRS